MNPVLLNITIPVYNRFYTTQKTILTLRKLNNAIPFSITVVDNGSEKALQDVLVDFAKNKIIDKLFILPRNMGISCACNIGWIGTDAPFFMKLDNNAVINDSNFIKKLFYFLEQIEPVATLGPAYLNEWIDNSPEIKETKFGRLAKCTTNLPGGALIIPKVVSDQLGYFNEDYNLYGAEDGDYGYRMRMAGFPQYYYENKNYFTKIYNNEEKYDVNKAQEHRNLFHEEDGKIGLFYVNCILFSYCIRRWDVPLRYKIIPLSEYRYDVVEREDYLPIKNALRRSQNMLNHLLNTQITFSLNNNLAVKSDLVEKLKKVWSECNQECTLENMFNTKSS